MKKEYLLSLSRVDRIYLTGFILFLLAWELVKHFIPDPQVREVIIADTIQVASDSLVEKQAFRKSSYTPKSSHSSRTNYTRPSEKTEERIPPAPVLISQATEQQLRSIGFSSKVASNITRYQTAGGTIRNEAALLKIYGMDSAQLRAVQPFLLYPETPNKESASPDSPRWTEAESMEIFELNTATQEDLESLPGIGPVLAERILKFRKALGGFMSVEQLQECYGLPPETFERIAPRLEVSLAPAGIEINAIDLDNFYHPYLDKKQVRLMAAYKKQHGPFRDARDLKNVFPPDSTWCARFLPYVIFD